MLSIPMMKGGLSMDEPILEVRNLSISYGNFEAVKHISFSLHPGHALAIVGKSGCGKSTILKAIMHILQEGGRITEGDILFRGKSLKTMSDGEWQSMTGRKIALIFQQPGSYIARNLKIGVQFRDFLLTHGVKESEWEELALRRLSEAGLPDGRRVLDSYVFQLSGGMQQKTASAMALAFKPPLILMDEPTSALDTVSSLVLLNRARKLLSGGTSIIFVTHNLNAAAYLADRLLIMEDGRMIEEGKAEEIQKNPRHAFTRELLDSLLTLR